MSRGGWEGPAEATELGGPLICPPPKDPLKSPHLKESCLFGTSSLQKRGGWQKEALGWGG